MESFIVRNRFGITEADVADLRSATDRAGYLPGGIPVREGNISVYRQHGPSKCRFVLSVFLEDGSSLFGGSRSIVPVLESYPLGRAKRTFIRESIEAIESICCKSTIVA